MKEIELKIGGIYLIKDPDNISAPAYKAIIKDISPNGDWIAYQDPDIFVDYTRYGRPYKPRYNFLRMVVDVLPTEENL
jgi:hypothetical protein